jgi:hypothetical protein
VTTPPNDAPAKLRALAVALAPGIASGPAMRGAWARGFCDGVRGRPSSGNPYAHDGPGWQHGMSGMFVQGWRYGRRVHRDDAAEEPEAYDALLEIRDRVRTLARAARYKRPRSKHAHRSTTIRRK